MPKNIKSAINNQLSPLSTTKNFTAERCIVTIDSCSGGRQKMIKSTSISHSSRYFLMWHKTRPWASSKSLVEFLFKTPEIPRPRFSHLSTFFVNGIGKNRRIVLRYMVQCRHGVHVEKRRFALCKLQARDAHRPDVSLAVILSFVHSKNNLRGHPRHKSWRRLRLSRWRAPHKARYEGTLTNEMKPNRYAADYFADHNKGNIGWTS